MNETVKICPKCSGPMESDWLICPNCGVSLEKEEPTEEKPSESPQPETRNCPRCGKSLNHEWVSCPYCPIKPVEKRPRESQSIPLQPQQSFLIGDLNLSKIFTRQLLIVGIALGLIIMLIGATVMNVSTIDEEDPDDEDDATAARTHQNGAIVYNLGVLILLFVLYATAIFNEDLNQFVRLGMLIAAGLISFNQIGARALMG